MYVPASSSAVFSDGSSSAISSVDIDNAANLTVGSAFIVTLTAATYLGTQGQPSLFAHCVILISIDGLHYSSADESIVILVVVIDGTNVPACHM